MIFTRFPWVGQVALALVVLGACVEPPAPRIEELASPTTIRSAGGFRLGKSVMDDRLSALTREVAMTLRDSAVRLELLAALHDSPFRESKLHFRTFLLGDGHRLFETLSTSMGGDARVLATLDSLVDLELYIPVPQHRATWEGEAELIVGSVMDDEGSPPHVFDIGGNPIVLRSTSPREPPEVPLLSLVPVETDFSRPPQVAGTVRRASTTSDPGVYMVQAYIPGDYEGLFKGAPEFEVHTLVRNGAGTFIDLQCSGEDQSVPFFYNHDNQTWQGGEVTLILENGIGTNPVEFSIWENDVDDSCRPTGGRPPEVDNGVISSYNAWGARPVTSVTSSGGTTIVGIQTLQMAVALADDYAGDDDDEVGELQFTQTCWPAQGPLRFDLHLSGADHPYTGNAYLDFRFGQRDPVCPPPPPPPEPLPDGSVQISGPSTVRPDDLCTYVGTASGGVAPYTFRWLSSSSGYLGEGSEMAVPTGSSNFDLNLDVFDANGRQGSDLLNVTVVSTARACFQ
jgi:hypothetical protein